MEEDELAIHLEALQRESCYRIDDVLKQSPFEVTQRVYFVGSNGAESGPYIRKFIQQGVGLGSVYQRMYEAQRDGRRFKYIPDMLECYSRNDRMVVVMECVRGQTLQEAVYQYDPSTELAADIFPRLCDAVSELHTEFNPPIIHRDIKPSNIILTGKGLVLIDFGISREYDADAESDTTHFGTREFAPPEQYGFGQTGVYSDVFSLGMVLFFCLTETIPNAKIREQGFRNERIPEPLRQVIAHASALDPAQRFASAAELKGAFLNALVETGQGEHAAQLARELQDEQSAQMTQGQPLGNQGQDGLASEAERTRQEYGNRDPFDMPESAQNVPTQQSASAPKRANSAMKHRVIAAIALALISILAFFGFAMCAKYTQSDSEVSAESGKAETATVESTESYTSKAADEATPSTTTTITEIDDGITISAAPKNGFNPDTNFTVTVGDLQFQIPSYFKKNPENSNDTLTYYYAETGSSVSMIMTKTNDMGETIDADEIEGAMDAYFQGVVESDKSAEIIGYSNFELAGCSARALTAKRSTAGLPTVSKLVFFAREGSPFLGTIMFGQTTNAQFDYSEDFAKVIASATPAPKE